MKKTKFFKMTMTGLTAIILASCAEKSTNGNTVNTVKSYPHNTCLVTGKKLGSMGDPVTIIHQGQEVKFCCPPCIEKFKADPEKYLSKL